MPLPCSIQDQGREAGKEYGIPFSGAMDRYAMNCVNHILGNRLSAAVLECCMIGPEIVFYQPTRIALGGSNSLSTINGQKIPKETALNINEGDILKIGNITGGRYVYLGIDGGFQSPVVWNSRSFLSSLEMVPLAVGSELYFNSPKNESSKSYPQISSQPDVFIDVVQGPEFDKLPSHLQKLLFSKHFTLSKLCDRMGYRLTGLQIPLPMTDMLSSGVFPGVVQLPPSGNPIILMRDAPPTGGYPRILVVTESYLNILAQKNTGDIIKFRLSRSKAN